MNYNIILLGRLNKILNLKNLFYVITFHDYELKFQGKSSPELIAYFEGKRFKRDDDDGFIEFKKSNITITLT